MYVDIEEGDMGGEDGPGALDKDGDLLLEVYAQETVWIRGQAGV